MAKVRRAPIYRCTAGHYCAVSEEAVTQAVVMPRCAAPLGRADGPNPMTCEARLVVVTGFLGGE